MAISWNGKEHRYSLHKLLDKALTYSMSRSEAEAHRDRFRSEIRLGTFRGLTADTRWSTGDPSALTFGDLADRYLDGHVRLPHRRPRGVQTMERHVRLLRRVLLPSGHGAVVPLESRRFDSVTRADVEEIRRLSTLSMPRAKGGVVGANRLLARLRHLFNWAIAQGYVDHSPFKRHGVTVVKLNGAAETPRDRRLDEGDEDKLIAVAGPRTQAIIIAALETGCRIGELLSLQWGQVRWTEGYILLNAAKTKTNEARSVPMTSRLRAVMEMRRTDVTGDDFPPTAYVFGNRIGERTSYPAFKKGWKQAYTKAGISGLHFHDLRREFASRLLETPGVSLHDVADWVGHSNITTTSRYLRTTGVRRQHVARRFEQSRNAMRPPTSSGATEPPTTQ